MLRVDGEVQYAYEVFSGPEAAQQAQYALLDEMTRREESGGRHAPPLDDRPPLHRAARAARARDRRPFVHPPA